jgi:hypothetical protein
MTENESKPGKFVFELLIKNEEIFLKEEEER